jgi:outer membrane lipoprotein-sorting protein
MIGSLLKKFLPMAVLCWGLSGCFLVYTKRRLPVPKAPALVQTVPADELVTRLNQRWAALDTLVASVEVSASSIETKKGEARDYTTFPANILMRKPEMLRVYGRWPVVHTMLFDMASDGKNFTLYVPKYNKAYKGATVLTKKAADPLLNMRPGFFLDALVVRGLEPEDYYAVTADTETIEDAEKKHLYSVPEYILTIIRHNPGTHKDTPVRVITFRRDDLLPYEQDIYDAEGNVETQVTYAGYQDTGAGLYPTSVLIKRPLEGKQLMLTIEKVTVNMKLSDDQFTVKYPEDAKVQTLE